MPAHNVCLTRSRSSCWGLGWDSYQDTRLLAPGLGRTKLVKGSCCGLSQGPGTESHRSQKIPLTGTQRIRSHSRFCRQEMAVTGCALIGVKVSEERLAAREE